MAVPLFVLSPIASDANWRRYASWRDGRAGQQAEQGEVSRDAIKTIVADATRVPDSFVRFGIGLRDFWLLA